MLKKLKNKKTLVLIDQMLVSGSNFLLGILLARQLGVESYGQFALLWLIVLFFSSLQLAYIISPMLTLGSKKSFLVLERYLSVMLYLQVLFSFLLMIGLYAFFEIAPSINEKWNIGDLKIYVIFTTLFFLSQDFLRRYFIIKTNYFKLILIDSIAYLGQLLIIAYFMYMNNLGLNTAFLSISVSFLLSLLIGYMQVSRVSTAIKYKRLIFLKNWKFSKWLVYSAILQWGSGNFFILVGGAILGSWSVGVIRVMQNTMGIFHVLFIALENILPINFAKIYRKNGYKSMMDYFKTQIKYGLIVFSILAVLVYEFAPNIIEFIYGSEYTQYSYLLVGFVGIYLFIYITMLQRYILRTIEMTKMIFISYVVTTTFSFLSSYPLIEYFKIDGILIGMFMIQLIMVGIFYQYIMKNRLKYV